MCLRFRFRLQEAFLFQYKYISVYKHKKGIIKGETCKYNIIFFTQDNQAINYAKNRKMK